jgi:ADP-ribose pyrophosphatase
LSFRLLGHRRLGQGVFLILERQHLMGPEGEPVMRDVVRHPGGVAVLPVDGDQVWLVSQRRAPFGREVVEIPAGKLERPDALAEAVRELDEEVGATAAEIIPLTRMYPSPGYTDEVIHIYAAAGLSFTARRPDGVEESHARVFSCRLDDALHRIETGEITDAKTQIALLMWDRRRRST